MVRYYLLENYLLKTNDSNKILGNDYLTMLFSRKNLGEKKERITSNLIYEIYISYYDYKNEEKYETIWLGRAGDQSKRTIGNNTLFLQPSLDKWMHSEKNTKSEMWIDSLNLSDKELAEKCEQYAEELFEKWNF